MVSFVSMQHCKWTSRFVANLGEQLKKHMKGMKICTRIQLYLVYMSLNSSKDSERDGGILKMVQRVEMSTAWNSRTFAKVCEVVCMDYWMNLKLMEDQLHTNSEKICQFLHAYFGKKEMHSKLNWSELYPTWIDAAHYILQSHHIYKHECRNR